MYRIKIDAKIRVQSCVPLFLLGVFLGACSNQKTGDQGPMVAKVNSRRISVNTFEEYMSKFSRYPGKNFTQDKGRFDLLKEMIDEELLFQEALDQKLYLSRPELKTELAKAMVNKKLEEFHTPIPEEELKKYYAAHQNELEKVHAAHILIAPKPVGNAQAEEKAKRTAEKLLKEIQTTPDKDFAYFAKKYSEDAANKDNGGDLGWFTRDQMVTEFSTAAFAIPKPGDLSPVVKSSFGYHIIKLQEEQRGFEAARLPIQQILQKERGKIKMEEYMQNLRQRAKVRIENDQVLKAQLRSRLPQ